MSFRDPSFDVKTWPSMNPLQRDMAFMNGNFITQSHAIMLLTFEEAEQVVDDLLGGVDKFFSYKAAPGNIKDGLDAFRNLSKLTTWYNPAQELVFNFKALKIRAIEYKVGGKSYIKITGHAGLRRILTGTRYGASHPQMLEMAIGQRGMSYSIINGTKYCIYFSLAWRAVELIFKSDYYLVDFLVDITMDTAKILVSSVVIGIAGGFLTFISSPVIVTISAIVFLGLILNATLNIIDDNFHLSSTLKMKIKEYYFLHGINIINNNASSLPYLF
ncbi:putative membrane protein [Trabulsiella guamensis ATCC 49490]|uniref:Putative membrane protein n=1 Tax=Trabulsiella guamensis ATCC 49490 TaxID=1005994 RepID=A0A085A3F9_9ENTR|nr:hypothetical protein [Trabulsiella guamensis]KFC04754.1 putative membrane protein [Trabulsiella guamensis ATCC 49490]